MTEKNSKTRIGTVVKKTNRQKVVKQIYLTWRILRKTDLRLIVYGPHVRQSVAMSYISI